MDSDPFRDLLERAFFSARIAGKRDWNRMIVAVLKNRLLQLTDRQFREEDFGAHSLLELTSRYRDLVTIDYTAKPVVIEWLQARSVDEAGVPAGRVRSDLWRATLDFSSGLQYEWDAVARHARPVQQADPERRLPTVDAATLATWREAFVKAREPTLPDQEDQERLRAWAARALGSQGLPRAVRAAWNDHLKRAVVAHLTSWFLASGQSVPDLG